MNQPLGGESFDSFRPRFDGAAISTYALAMVAVPTKLWCRSRVSGMASMGWDDLLCVITLIFANGFFWVVMIGMWLLLVLCSLGTCCDGVLRVGVCLELELY